MHPKRRPWEATVHSEPPRPAPDSNHKVYTKENPQRSEEAGVIPQGWEEGDSTETSSSAPQPYPPRPRPSRVRSVFLFIQVHTSGTPEAPFSRFTPKERPRPVAFLVEPSLWSSQVTDCVVQFVFLVSSCYLDLILTCLLRTVCFPFLSS